MGRHRSTVGVRIPGACQKPVKVKGCTDNIKALVLHGEGTRLNFCLIYIQLNLS